MLFGIMIDKNEVLSYFGSIQKKRKQLNNK